MATQARQTSTALGTLARRFAGQVLLSGAVMLTLNAATRIDLGLGDAAWPGMADQATTDLPRRETLVLPSLDLAGALRDDDEEAVAEASSLAPAPAPIAAPIAAPAAAMAAAPAAAPAAAVREARLPVPARLFARNDLAATDAPSQPVLLAASSKHRAPAAAAGLKLAQAEGVLLFDQCRPACETQDPLARRPQGERAGAGLAPSPRTRLAALAPAQPAAEPAAILREAEIQGPPPQLSPATQPPASGLLSRSLSTARDTTLAAAGSLVRLVSW